MLYLIGLGLNFDGISKFGVSVVQKCKKVYLENYTVEFPYSKGKLEEVLSKKIIEADREFVEGLEIVDEAEKMDVALLVYGSPLTATTHIALIQEANRLGIKFHVMYNASILDAVAGTGLQLYKFGKIASMPDFKADSFIDVVKENRSIGAHSLILIDIGLEFEKALERLEKVAAAPREGVPSKEGKKNIKLDKIVVCSKLGTKSKRMLYRKFEEFRGEEVQAPFCFVIPGKLHFLEEEVLEGIGKN
jgi:diphthine synthase